MILAYLLATWLPYQIYSAFVGPAFAVGWRAIWIGVCHITMACAVAWFALPGKSMRLVAWQVIGCLCISVACLFWLVPTGSYRRYLAEYWVLNGACMVGAVQNALATGTAVYRHTFGPAQWRALGLVGWLGISAVINGMSRWLPWATDNAGAVREWWVLRHIDDGVHWALLPALLYVEWRIWRDR